MQKKTDSYTFGKVPKTTRKPFFDMLKNKKEGIENKGKNTIIEVFMA